MISQRRFILYLAAWAAVSAFFGCRGISETHQSLFQKARDELPEIQTAREAFQLEILFLRRPAGDLLIQSLFREIDQVGAIDSRAQHWLRAEGFRVGVSSSTPPRSLQSMLGLSSGFADEWGSDPATGAAANGLGVIRKNERRGGQALSPSGESDASFGGLAGRRIVLRAGAETEVQTSPFYETCAIEVPSADGHELKRYAKARCLFRVKAERVQDGWAKLRFLPEMHSGQQRLRHVATEARWQLRTSQKIDPLFEGRFEVTLNLGEMVVITADGKDPRSLGHHFFIGAGEDDKMQRLLVVRLADMGDTQSIYAGQ